jgi:hypothetical protein
VGKAGTEKPEHDAQRESRHQPRMGVPQKSFHRSLRCIYMSASCGGPPGAGMLAQTLKMGNRFLGVYGYSYGYLCIRLKC